MPAPDQGPGFHISVDLMKVFHSHVTCGDHFPFSAVNSQQQLVHSYVLCLSWPQTLLALGLVLLPLTPSLSFLVSSVNLL